MLSILGGLTLMGIMGGSGTAHGAEPLPKPVKELAATPAKDGETRSVVFAGGCFWCT